MFSTACQTGQRTLPAVPVINLILIIDIFISKSPSPSAPEVSGASVDDSAMEVCGNRAGSEILGTCSGHSSSASSSALKHPVGDDF